MMQPAQDWNRCDADDLLRSGVEACTAAKLDESAQSPFLRNSFPYQRPGFPSDLQVHNAIVLSSDLRPVLTLFISHDAYLQIKLTITRL
jgi:hypothetical protein